MADPIRLVPSVFDRTTGAGDFATMIEDPAYADALFVYNDNEPQSARFLDQVEAGETPTECGAGGGNAAIRPYQCGDAPRAAGVPTGPGWTALADGRAAIDRAVRYVARLLATGRYRRVIYSARSAAEPDVLGSGIFDPPRDVLTYVPAELKRIVDEANADGA